MLFLPAVKLVRVEKAALPGYLAGSGLVWDACAWTTPPLSPIPNPACGTSSS